MGFREEFGELLTAIADEADKIAMRFFRSAELKRERKIDGTVVTSADKAIEQMALERVASSGLKLDVLGEEFGEQERHGAARLIIDPIDGTEEFSRGIPTFGTLLGIEQNGEIVAAVASAPALRGRWQAYRGQGAWRHGRKLQVSNVSSLKDAMVFTNGADALKALDALERIQRLTMAARRSRALGGFWPHMLVAEGAIEAAMDVRSKPWDLAPSFLVVEEAGGRSTTLSGERSIYQGNLISSNGILHDEILSLLR